MTDIEIAKQVNLENILDIAKKTNIDENDVELYGKYKAKISNFEKYNKNSKGKLVLVAKTAKATARFTFLYLRARESSPRPTLFFKRKIPSKKNNLK